MRMRPWRKATLLGILTFVSCVAYMASRDDRPTLDISNQGDGTLRVYLVGMRVATVMSMTHECVRIPHVFGEPARLKLLPVGGGDSAWAPPEYFDYSPGWALEVTGGPLAIDAISLRPAPTCIPRNEQPRQ